MWLILVNSNDQTGPWLRQGLLRRGLSPVELVAVEELLAADWVHRLSDDGQPQFEVTVPDGREFDSGRLRGMVNRITYLPVPPGIAATDRDYVTLELNAFLLSVLSAVPGPVFNPPTPRGLSGAWRHQSEWLPLAWQAGLACRSFEASSTQQTQLPDAGRYEGPTAITVGSQIVDDGLSEPEKQACLRLARVAGTPHLEVRFALDADGAPIFAAASPLPQLERAGDSILDAFAYVLQEGEAA